MAIVTKPLPSFELLQELFEVSPDSPSGLRWRNPRSNRVKAGEPVGALLNTGYWQVTLKIGKKSSYMVHRIVYYLQTGIDPGDNLIDHTFGKQDSVSLRLVTQKENSRNRKKQQFRQGKQCSSKHKGVCWHKTKRKWYASIVVEYKNIHLGVFDNEIDAAIAYNNAAIFYFGEFALLNSLE
jgi:hypothetical protein